ncbi:acylneuraminate cytidylyltransferase family protein [Zunongwangia sp. F363]|uniref:Acylneuraminate cytidylyltransferase family protein n=1 Tax=Autumnicola tepida TaxID=3075595 RepID=A0ABU3C9P5_9FLAO|nr:acylneuraminate cytidylyltransferase family protein [Zunongwangia sp. F363]MDT0643036.1 acylneuraminate cytidylyltransferase family protein [Zunongwangia sp. F363]
MKILGIIPARGGSKGVPGKNVRQFDGKPLLAYAVEAARESSKISKLVVNTEDKEISEVAKNLKCEVIHRNHEMAADNSPVIDAVLQTLNFLKENNNEEYDAVLLLQPTAPLRTGSDIDAAVKLLKSNPEKDAVISMAKVEDHHPARMYSIKEESLICQMPEYETRNRQELPELYIRNGCIYLVRTSVLKKEKTLIPPKKLAYIMESKWSVNVDTEMDAILLNELLKKWKKQKR